MWCHEPFVDYLRDLGFHVILIPKADVTPLELLAKNGPHVDRIGKLDSILEAPNKRLPKVKMNIQAANIAIRKVEHVRLNLGISILDNIIAAMGGSRLGISGIYNQARTLSLEFDDVLEDRVDITSLDQYLAEADISRSSRYIADLLEADAVYIITATIKGRRITVEARAHDNTALALDVPIVQGTVGAGISVSKQAGSESRLTYEGKVPLVFGFKTQRLVYENNSYVTMKLPKESMRMRSFESSVGPLVPVPSEDVASNRTSGHDRAQSITSAPFVRLRDIREC